MSAIHQVDPIALRQKLRKLGIGPGLRMSQTFAEDAVRDCLNRHALDDAIERSREFHSRTMAPGPGSLVLEPEELAYCLDAWARLWEVPA